MSLIPVTCLKTKIIGLIGLLVLLGYPGLGAVAPGESFDPVVRKTIVNLGRSRYLMPNDTSRILLSCFYYPEFMVKELNDPGLKGIRWVTILPIASQSAPACRLAHSSKERFWAKTWWSFMGVKGPLIFLEAADGENGGMPFRILDIKTGKKIFQDSAWGTGGLAFAHSSDGGISAKYLRVVGESESCSIPKDGLNCWNKFRKHYGLMGAEVPKCSGYRNEGKKERAVGTYELPPEEITTASVIIYPVEVTLFPRPKIKPVNGSIACNPIE